LLCFFFFNMRVYWNALNNNKEVYLFYFVSFFGFKKPFYCKKNGVWIWRFIEDLEYFVERLAILNGDLPVSCDSDSLVLNRYKHVSKGLEKTFFFAFRTYSNYEKKSLVMIIFNMIGILSILILICGIWGIPVYTKLSLDDVFYIKWIAKVFGGIICCLGWLISWLCLV